MLLLLTDELEDDLFGFADLFLLFALLLRFWAGFFFVFALDFVVSAVLLLSSVLLLAIEDTDIELSSLSASCALDN